VEPLLLGGMVVFVGIVLVSFVQALIERDASQEQRIHQAETERDASRAEIARLREQISNRGALETERKVIEGMVMRGNRVVLAIGAMRQTSERDRLAWLNETRNELKQQRLTGCAEEFQNPSEWTRRLYDLPEPFDSAMDSVQSRIAALRNCLNSLGR